jgi:two-component system, cell cycle sensor histidine kinase and response regulator CckA
MADPYSLAPRRFVRRVLNSRQSESYRTKGQRPSQASYFCAASLRPTAEPTLSHNGSRPSILVDLNDVIVESGRLLVAILGSDIDLVIQPAPGMLAVTARPVRILQMLLNMAAIARASMPNGGQLTLTTEFRPTQKNRGKLAAGRMTNDSWHPSGVAGNRWIPSLSLPAACLPRQSQIASVVLRITATTQGDEKTLANWLSGPVLSTHPSNQDSAMRLTTILALVRELGGNLEIENHHGQHSASLMLPAGETPPSSVAPEALPQVSEKPGGNILVASNIDHVRSTIYSALTMDGYTVLLSTNGIEALARAESSKLPIGLLITDMAMAGMTGEQLAVEMLTIRPNLRLLLLCCYNSKVAQGPEFSGKTVGFLERPFTPTQLVHKVRELLEQTPALADHTQP